MNTEKDVIDVAMMSGGPILVHAEGNPAMLVAGAVVVGAVVIVYGTYKYGSKLLDFFGDLSPIH